MTEPRTLTEAVNLGKTKTEQVHLLGQVAGINKAIKALSRASFIEATKIQGLVNELMEESRLLLKEAEQLTKPVTEEEKKQILEP